MVNVCLSDAFTLTNPPGHVNLSPYVWSRLVKIVDIDANIRSNGQYPLQNGYTKLPGYLLQDTGLQQYTNTTNTHVHVTCLLNRGGITLQGLNPNVMQVREFFRYNIGNSLNVEPNGLDSFNSVAGIGLNFGTNSDSTPKYGVSGVKFSRSDVKYEIEETLAPGETLFFWYKSFCFTPAPWTSLSVGNHPPGGFGIDSSLFRVFVQIVTEETPGSSILSVCSVPPLRSDHGDLSLDHSLGLQLLAEEKIIGEEDGNQKPTNKTVLLSSTIQWTNTYDYPMYLIADITKHARSITVSSPNYATLQDAMSFSIGKYPKTSEPAAIPDLGDTVGVQYDRRVKQLKDIRTVYMDFPSKTYTKQLGTVAQNESIILNYRCIFSVNDNWRSPAEGAQLAAYARGAHIQLFGHQRLDLV